MLRQATVRQLEAFREVMLSGTFTNAARRLGVTQPAVSKLIADLEAYFGTKLFIRSKTKLKPTSIAYTILDEFEKIHASFERFIDIATIAAKNQRRIVKFGAIPVYAETVAPVVIASVYEHIPNVFVSLEVLPHNALIKALQVGEIDVAFTPLPSGNPSLIEHTLSNEPAVVVTPKNHALAKRTRISLCDLKDEPIITLPPSSPLQVTLDSYLSAKNFVPNCIMYARTQTAIISLVRLGLGIAIMNKSIAELLKEQIHIASFEEDFSWSCGMLLSKDGSKSKLIDDLLPAAKSAIKNFGT
ncbi:MAG: LysR family transcriptional regulator [Pseudomonadota bacterium]